MALKNKTVVARPMGKAPVKGICLGLNKVTGRYEVKTPHGVVCVLSGDIFTIDEAKRHEDERVKTAAR